MFCESFSQRHQCDDKCVCLSLSETHMVLSTVKETSGLYTVKSILNMAPTKADKDSVFHCTVEYSLAGEQNKNKEMKSEPMKIELYCE